VFDSIGQYSIDLASTPGSGARFAVDTVAIANGEPGFLGGSLSASRVITIDGGGRADFSLGVAVAAPLIDIRTGHASILGGTIDAAELTIGANGSSFWYGVTRADVGRLDLDGHLLVTELSGMPEQPSQAVFGEVGVASGGWFNQARNVLFGPLTGPVANSSTVRVERSLAVDPGGRYELVEGRLEIGAGDPSSGLPGLAVHGTFRQEGGELAVAGDALVTGAFTAQNWFFPSLGQSEAPVIDIDGRLTVAGTGQFDVASGLAGGRVRLGSLTVGGFGSGPDGRVSTRGLAVEVAGAVTVEAGGELDVTDLRATDITNAGVLDYAAINLGAGVLRNSGRIRSFMGDATLQGRLENLAGGSLELTTGRRHVVSAGIVNELGGALALRNGSTLATPTLLNDGDIVSSGTSDNVIEGQGGMPVRVDNRGLIDVQSGRLRVDGFLTSGGVVRFGPVLLPNALPATAASAPGESLALAAASSPTPILEVTGDFQLEAGGSIDAPPGSMLRVGGDFTSTVPTSLDLGDLSLVFFGGGSHRLTAAGHMTLWELGVEGDGTLLLDGSGPEPVQFSFLGTTLDEGLFARLDVATGVHLLFGGIDSALLEQLSGRHGGVFGGGGSFSAVPIPAAGWMFVAGLLVLGTRGRGRRAA